MGTWAADHDNSALSAVNPVAGGSGASPSELFKIGYADAIMSARTYKVILQRVGEEND